MNDKSLSILIPARNEMFLERTIQDIMEKREGDTEVIAVLDGEWPDPGVQQRPGVTIVYLPESIGQRAATNLACRLSNAKYVMKTDAHVAFDQGFDVKMMDAMEDDMTMVPVMKNLHAFDWVCVECGKRVYQGRYPDKCYLDDDRTQPNPDCNSVKFRHDIVWKPRHRTPNSTSYRFDKTLHFEYFNEYKERQEGDLVETMSLQGSCFMLTREKYWELDICDEKAGSWGHQGSEVALKTWLSGGRVICNKNTWYAHMFRTKGGDFGFPWPAKESEFEKTRQYIRDIFLTDSWPKAKHTLQWLVDKFSPVPGWD